ncbi:MAG: glycogen/starch/alpha-glucan phosphorylase [Deltaproteobacteria bacterium]|nr:glycogen/starch/alpha-glucan phosphorylase [Deltaproteobacteria bacterium]
MNRPRRPFLWREAESEPTRDSIKQTFIRHIQSSLAKDEFSATNLDRYQAMCFSVRDCLVERWVNTQQTYYQSNARRVYYLSLEYLMGRALSNAMISLGYYDEYQQALEELGLDLEELAELGVDAGLGNGGLGRLAACFLDSMATLELPAYGYGLRYDFGIFRQAVRDGYQVEEPDAWLRLPYPWEFPREEYLIPIRFGGWVDEHRDEQGRLRHKWRDAHVVMAMPYDTPVPGYGNNTVNTLRLWRARATEDFDLDDFNAGDYIGALEHRVLSENITRVLYPNDSFYLGKELRLKQEYFLVSATLQDAIRRHLVNHASLDDLHEKAVFQLNDTHPALAVAELMRLLLDEHGYGWDQAWQITSGSMAYTNHTLLPEALEKWPADLLGRLLPRHMQIINEANARFLDEVRRRFPGDEALVRRLSIYEEGDTKRVRMAHLAIVGSFSVNGVAALHTELLKSNVVPDFHRLWPHKFNNKTNGVTQRRWLLACNRPLARLISDRIGEGWITNLDELEKLGPLCDDAGVHEELSKVKMQAKHRLARMLRRKHGIAVDPSTLFDVQIKRIHEYKRQLLNALHVIHLYCQIRKNPRALATPHTFLIGGKAAPGYKRAKLIIKLIGDVAARVNGDRDVSPHLRVHFVPDYNVSIAELLFPAADVSEQISTAGFEASGTGNMKFALNGALTIGTLDGANVEIADRVGAENIFIFGHNVEQVAQLREQGYRPRQLYEADAGIREVLDLLASSFFNPNAPGLYQPIVDSLLADDYFLLLADFDSYRQAHQRIDQAYRDRPRWCRMAVKNIAGVGFFSSDRTIREYARDIWKVSSHPIFVE